jgi:hypothetical protein
MQWAYRVREKVSPAGATPNWYVPGMARVVRPKDGSLLVLRIRIPAQP